MRAAFGVLMKVGQDHSELVKVFYVNPGWRSLPLRVRPLNARCRSSKVKQGAYIAIADAWLFAVLLSKVTHQKDGSFPELEMFRPAKSVFEPPMAAGRRYSNTRAASAEFYRASKTRPCVIGDSRCCRSILSLLDEILWPYHNGRDGERLWLGNAKQASGLGCAAVFDLRSRLFENHHLLEMHMRSEAGLSGPVDSLSKVAFQMHRFLNRIEPD